MALRVHIAKTHFNAGGNNLNRIPLMDDQETCLKCTICRKMINKSKMKKHMDEKHGDESLLLSEEEEEELFLKCTICRKMINKSNIKKHMEEKHSDESLVLSEEEEQEICLKCLICRKMINKSEIRKHMEERHGDESLLLSEEEDQPTLNKSVEENTDTMENMENMEKEDNTKDDDVGTVLLVKRKTLWWPALKVKSDRSTVSVKLLNKTRTKVTVSMEHVKPFKVDHSQMDGMKRDWRTAYMTAVKIVRE